MRTTRQKQKDRIARLVLAAYAKLNLSNAPKTAITANLARKYNISESTVNRILKASTHAHSH